jgi:hypothetical protein
MGMVLLYSAHTLLIVILTSKQKPWNTVLLKHCVHYGEEYILLPGAPLHRLLRRVSAAPRTLLLRSWDFGLGPYSCRDLLACFRVASVYSPISARLFPRDVGKMPSWLTPRRLKAKTRARPAGHAQMAVYVSNRTRIFESFLSLNPFENHDHFFKSWTNFPDHEQYFEKLSRFF